MWYRIFGKKGKFGIPDKDYPDDIVFLKRIEKICKNYIEGIVWTNRYYMNENVFSQNILFVTFEPILIYNV